MKSRGLKRLIFIFVFLLPVVWYLILQLFGHNRFALDNAVRISPACGSQEEITIIARMDSLTIAETNYMNRVVYAVQSRDVRIKYEDSTYFQCIDKPDADLVLINKEGLWGSYILSREGVDQLLTELDILILQQSYGAGTKR